MRIAVIGAGVMGTGVAQAAAERGLEVVLVDMSDEVLSRALARIRRDVRLTGMLRGGPRLDPKEVLARIEPTTLLDRVAGAELVVENVTEDEALKAALYPDLDRFAATAAIFAVNTSCIPVARIAAHTTRADRVVGVHFMNPVSLKPVVEVIRGPATSDETLERTRAFLAHLGKDAIVVRDAPGFVSNRVLMLAINEAARVVEEGTAPPADADRIFRECMGHAMGPLETADLIGLDTIVRSLEVLEHHLGARFAPCALLRRMVAEGKLGAKSGRGFYEHGLSTSGA